MPTPQPDLIVFDCDGVLVDSELLAAAVLARELTALGFRMTTRGCIERYSGIAMGEVMRRIEAEWGQTLPPDFGENIRARDVEAFRTELQPVSGARAMLGSLAHRRCVASSGRLAKMRLTLSLTGLLEFFEPHVFSAEMVDRGKPAPDLFLHAADRMGVLPSRCVVVEDSLAGVRAAVAAGMRVLGFVGGSHCTKDHGRSLQDAGAETVFNRLADLPRLLQEPR
jgi:HAD superfamily hydrolase (TIGR01509 family)